MVEVCESPVTGRTLRMEFANGWYGLGDYCAVHEFFELGQANVRYATAED
jgi:hypothetical protein